MQKALVALSITLSVVAPALRAADPDASAKAFLAVYRVLQHPRCMNCHPVGDRPLHGDDSHPHSFGVRRGADGHGVAGKRCTRCHQAANQAGEHKPPGAPQATAARLPAGTPRWHLPSARMPLVFQGRSPGQLCRQLLNPKTNGGLAPADLIEHVAHDPFVVWAWNPGDGRSKPPGSHASLLSAVRTWIEQGAACPAE